MLVFENYSKCRTREEFLDGTLYFYNVFLGHEQNINLAIVYTRSKKLSSITVVRL